MNVVPIVIAEVPVCNCYMYLYICIFYSAIFLRLNLAFASKKDSYVLMGQDFCLLLVN